MPRVAVVTGVGRLRGIASSVVGALAEDGWDVAGVFHPAYDERIRGIRDERCQDTLAKQLAALGRAYLPIDADVSEIDTAAAVFDQTEKALGPVTALVIAHTESVSSGLMDTTVESFDRHYEVNVRGTWLLIKTFGERFRSERGSGRVVTFTSDHAIGNVPYGATKGAADRVIVAASAELGALGITSNAINPGPVDTGWMSDDQLVEFAAANPLGRLGSPEDAANLVRFLCSSRGGWINGQLLYSNGGSSSNIQ